MNMRQTLHIFKKDARHLRWEIALVLLLTAAFAYVDAHPLQNTVGAALSSYQWWDQALKLLLVLAWFVLMERVIHSEALPGNKQFWLTRPYSWKSLLAAKTLFLLAFITLPMMIADSAIVTEQGFSVAAHLPGLLWLQALRFALLMVPIAGLAAITEGLTGMMFWAVVIIAATVGFSAATLDVGSPEGLQDWIRNTIESGLGIAAVIAIVIWQYARRQTLPARTVYGCVLAVGSLVTLIPGSTVFPLDAAPSLMIGLDSSRKPIVQKVLDMVYIDLPLRFAGVPEGLTVGIDASWAHIEGRDVSGPRSEPSRVRIRMNSKLFERVKNEPIRIRVSLYLTLFGNPRTFPLPPDTASIPIPKVGLCDTDVPNPVIYHCRSPFRMPRVRVLVNGNRGIITPTYSPYPAEFGISPMTSANFRGPVPAEPPSVTLTTEEPMAHLRRDVAFENIRLADFYNE
jgi:hypothetical protein